MNTVANQASTRELAKFAAALDFDELPDPVIERIEALFLDWVASALAGRNAPPVRCLERFAQTMGPARGPCEILVSRRRTSPFFAALVNGAASHVVELDDLHNGSVMHPGTVVFPAVLAAAQDSGASGRDLITAAVAGYEVGIRAGEYLGRSHYRVFHTTGTAGTLAAAAGVARLLRLDAGRMNHALGSAGTQAAGLWEFLRDGAHSKQLHSGKAAANGLMAAYLARDGFTGAQRILEGPRGVAAAMSADAREHRLVADLGQRWAVNDVSFKIHAACRHTHPAADALSQLMNTQGLAAQQIARIQAHVHQAALDVLGPVANPNNTHQAKFSMGFVLALIALRGEAGPDAFSDVALRDPELRAFSERVEMILDHDVDRAYPERWIGRITVTTTDGRQLTAQVDTPRGDPGNPVSRAELEAKALTLAAFQQGASATEMTDVIARICTLRDADPVGCILEGA